VTSLPRGRIAASRGLRPFGSLDGTTTPSCVVSSRWRRNGLRLRGRRVSRSRLGWIRTPRWTLMIGGSSPWRRPGGPRGWRRTKWTGRTGPYGGTPRSSAYMAEGRQIPQGRSNRAPTMTSNSAVPGG